MQPSDEAGRLYARAVGEHRQGRIAAAQALYRAALAHRPAFADALHGLGVTLLQQNRLAEAAAALETAARLSPDDAALLGNLGFALNQLGRGREALAPLQRAASLSPGSPVVATNLAIALLQSGDLDAARQCLGALIAAQPQLAEPHNILGSVLLEQGALAEAAAAFERALTLKPDFAAARTNLGNVFAKHGDFSGALTCYEQALTIAPDFAPAYYDCGTALAALGRHAAAVAAYDKALAHNPRHAAACNNRGTSLNALGRPGEAREAFERALAIDPGHAAALFGLGTAMQALGFDEDAAAAHARALALDGTLAEAAAEAFRLAARRCDWSDFDRRRGDLETRVAAGQRVDPWVFLHASDDPALQYRAARTVAGTKRRPPHRTPSQRRLRIAYLSADFCEHPVAQQFAEVLERHDRTGFEISGYCIHPAPRQDAMRTRLIQAFDHFAAVGTFGDEDIAACLDRDGIDIAVDLTGHTRYGRLGVMAHTHVPVTVACQGYAGTCASDAVDYVIGDAVLIPPELEPHFSEKIVRLPGSFMWSDTTEPLAPPPRAGAGLPSQGLVFCSFNLAEKLTPELFAVWMEILAAVPGSVLWLAAAPAARANLAAAAQSCGVAPERLVYAPRVPDHAAHLARLQCADIYLDTFPYGGHATANDALRAGVAPVALIGRSFAARVAASMLTAAGLAGLIATDLESYKALALGLARDPSRRAAIRAQLTDANPLFDMARFAGDLEKAYRVMAERAAAGLAPESFSL